ncbi:MAG: N-acetylmuramoyl-L-alanine amidase [Pseudomonadota bacterium]|nr:N-acetylmuramoyl-L-alanine amidase [Pseudomonadota bacterium]
MRLFFLSFFLAALSLSGVALAGESLQKIRLGVHPDKTRFVAETTAGTKFTVFTLTGPDRVVIDMAGMDWKVQGQEPAGGLVTGWRHGRLDDGTLRIVLDTMRPVMASGMFIPPRDGFGTRFVLDMHPVEQAAQPVLQPAVQPVSSPVMAGGIPIPPRPPRLSRPPMARPAQRPLVVIDPGHGGIDPGAIGVGGVYEKEITMGVARALKNELENTGRWRVLLTREDDTFVRLRERVAIAREHGASLFISLHADSISKDDVRGLSVYTLSEQASDREAAALADKENRVDEIAGVAVADQDQDVVSILFDLAQRDTMVQSRRLAGSVVKELDGDIILLRSALRSAGFAVLTAPDIPSILIEMGYLSSPKDSRLLARPDHHRTLAREIRKAIDAWAPGQTLADPSGR